MRPTRMIISGWGPYKGLCDINFGEFDKKGLFLITGATGAGKTTIFDAICFALYGDVSGGVREKGSVRSDFADGDTKTFVELTFEHNDKLYKISRNPEYERPKKRKTGNAGCTKERENAILYLPDDSIIEGNQEVNRKIREILVLDLKQFKQITMIAQGEFAKLLMAPSKEKNGIFREIFGTGICEAFANVLRRRAKALYSDVSTMKSKLEEAVRMTALPDDEYKQLTDKEDLNFDNINEYLKNAEKKYLCNAESTLQEYTELDKKMNVLTAEISKLEEQRKQLLKKETELLEAKTGIEKLNEEKIEYRPIFEARDGIYSALRLREQCEQLRMQQSKQAQMVKELETELTRLPDEYMVQEEKCRKARRAYEEGDFAYRRATAGIVARLLEDGKPCPVCGSTFHPSPASVGEDVPDEKRLKELQKQVNEADKKLQKIQEFIVEKKGRYEAYMSGLQKLSEELEECINEFNANPDYPDIFKEMAVSEAYRKLDFITGRYQNIEGLIAEKEEYAARLEVQIKSEKEEAVSGEKQDELEKQCLEMESKKRKLLEEQKQWNIYVDAIKRTRRSLKEKLAKLNELSTEYGYVKDLDNVANGMNPRRLVFEQYVLSTYFDEILRAANIRFLKMTDGRYEMSRVETVSDGRSRDNLEIQVLDYYTGKFRSVKTLSGGETFKASLALALGMSDVIQAFNGGIRVEALFVDEGFGSLDSESLDQACETLSTLVEKDRMIGIISHVPELRERIENQIVVYKTNTGSEVQIVV